MQLGENKITRLLRRKGLCGGDNQGSMNLKVVSKWHKGTESKIVIL